MDDRGQTSIEILIATAVVILLVALIGFYLKSRIVNVSKDSVGNLQDLTDSVGGN